MAVCTARASTGALLLRGHGSVINATVGFGRLGETLGVKSLMRMCGPTGNPRADNLLATLATLAALRSHVGLEVRVKASAVSDRARTPARSRAAIAA